VVTIVPASPGDTSLRAARFWRSGGGKARETATKEVRVATVEESIVVDVPLRTTYNQWTQFEEFPKFMEGVESVKQLDDTASKWRAEIGGEKREWRAEIVEQIPDRRIEWRAAGHDGPHGIVMFRPLNENLTEITVQMDYEPEGFKETVGSLAGSDSRRVKGDLERFKKFIEARQAETGAWRAEVREGVAPERHS
jgi:uncharacterized membrane protein